MGLSEAAQIFQRFMDEIFRDVSFVFVYIDDILIFFKSVEEHYLHLKAVFDRLVYYGLIVNERKCIFGVEYFQFLGHDVGPNGIRPLEEKVRAFKEFPKPKTPKQLWQFLGMLNFYRKFVPKCSTILQPLHVILSRRRLEWTDVVKNAFEVAKKIISEKILLAYPEHDAPITFMVDASENGAGAVVQQTVDGVKQPLMFFSQSFNQAQKNYSTFDRELLAMYMAVRYFSWFLESRDFCILTDHKPLVAAFKSPMNNSTHRQSRHLSTISEYTTNVQHTKGTENVVADCLSRTEINAIFSDVNDINFAEIAIAQMTDEFLPPALSKLKIVEQTLPKNKFKLLGDISTGRFRPLILESFQRTIFDRLHSLSHGRIRATRKLISERFVWPKMRTDIRD